MESDLRRQIYAILILVSGGLIFGRILAVDSLPDRTIQEYRLTQIPKRLADKKAELSAKKIAPDRIDAELKKYFARLMTDAKKERPTLSANDRSRWLTLRALVEPESRVYRYLPLSESGEKKSRCTVGEVLRNCGGESADRFEKANLKAKKYVKQLVPYAIDKAMETPGWETIDMVKHGRSGEEFDPENPLSGYLYSSKPTLLPTLMAAPYWLLHRVFGLSLRTDPFLTARTLLTILNLLPLLIGWFYAARLIERFGKTDWGRLFAMATLCFGTFLSTFAVTLNNHLPCVVCVTLAVYAGSRILADGQKSGKYFLAAGFFGAMAVACELPAALIAFFLCAALLWKYPAKTLALAVPAGLLVVAGFFGANFLAHETLRPAYAQKRDHLALARAEHPDDPESVLVTSFDPDDWYIYRFIPSGKVRRPENARLSYWANRVGVDRGEPSRAVYAFQATFGHHGIFSLSPVWLLSMAGLIGLLARRGKENAGARLFAASVLTATLVFFVFYLTRDQGDRNYGGMTSGLRWFFPLIPLWILAALPELDRISPKRFGRGIALALLFFSAMSVAYPLWNPWSHPWFYHLMYSLGWIS